jgi:predicted alpha/beta-fold hydrolase
MKFLTEESPAKVMALLGVTLTSMAFLFGVSVSNANFQKTEVALSNPFDPSNVVAVLDNATNAYSKFVAANFTQPLKSDLAFYRDTGHWIIDNSDQQILAMTGLSSLAVYHDPQAPEVAGAYTDVASSDYQSISQGYEPIGLFQVLGVQ